MEFDLVWNETLAEQVRSQTENAMKGQVDDIMRTADQFMREADRHEAQAA